MNLISHKRSLRIFQIAIAIFLNCGVTAAALGQQVLYPNIEISIPTNETTNVLRERGRKGLLFYFRFQDGNNFDSNAGFPLDMSSSTVTMQIGANPQINCLAGNNPAANACAYITVDGPDFDAALDTVKILYNGDFPATTPIKFSVAGAKSTPFPMISQNADPNIVAFTTGNAVPRAPASLELVLDISGSMSSPAAPPPAVCGSTTRMVALQTAAQSFFAMLNSNAMLGDKVGAVYFSTGATVFDPTPGGTNLEPAHDLTQVGLISANVQVQIPTSSTSIGSGLQAANVSGFAADPNPNVTKRVFLFSDGEQNTVPCVGQPNASPCNSTVSMTPPIQVGGSPYPADIKICPVTVGQFSGPAYVLQQSIGNVSCDGHYVHAILKDPTNPTACVSATNDLTTFFTQTLANVLVGDKLEHVRDVTGQVAAGIDTTEKFLANAKDVALNVSLSWDAKGEIIQIDAERSLPFRLKAPDGTLIDPRPHTQFRRGMSFTTIHFPLRQNGAVIYPKGEWEVQLLGTLLRQPVSYHLIVMLDNPNIASDYRIDIKDGGIGEPIPVRVRLTENGAPVAGANIVAQLIGPENGVGNILSTTPTPAGTPNTGGDTLRSEAQRKLLLLLQDPASADLFKDKSLPSLVLLDNGRSENGDTAVNDGIYSGLFTGALQEGHYRFVINVRGTSATNGDFMRTQLLTVFVRPKPVAANTAFTLLSSATQPNGNVIIRLQAIPKDKFGNFVGPDYLGHLNITCSEGTVETQLADKLDGSYEISYRLPSAASNPACGLEVMGTTVVSKTVDELQNKHPHRNHIDRLLKWLLHLFK